MTTEGSDRHCAEARAETRLSGTLAHRFDEYRATHGADKSDVLRDALDDDPPASENLAYVVPRDPTSPTPTSPSLATGSASSAWRRPWATWPTTHPDTPEELVEDDVLKPLGEGVYSVSLGAASPFTRLRSGTRWPMATERPTDGTDRGDASMEGMPVSETRRVCQRFRQVLIPSKAFAGHHCADTLTESSAIAYTVRIS